MGKQPVRLKAVVYAFSPFQQKVMTALWKDLPGKIHHKVSENRISATLLLGPLIGVHTHGRFSLLLLPDREKANLSLTYSVCFLPLAMAGLAFFCCLIEKRRI